MEKSKVSIVKVADYGSEKLYEGIKKGLDYLGGLETIIKPGSKVFVKINHLSPPSPPEKVIITHPCFTKQVLRLLKQLNCKIIVGDDIQSKSKDGFLISGYRKVCDQLGVHLVNLKESGFKEVTCRGQVLKKVYVSPIVLESDFIVNLPKLKTHSLTVFTGSIKNMFGIIPLGLRIHYHRQYFQNDIFGQMLVDIFSTATPHLTIMDGIKAMEGEGPSAGKPRDVGVILASRDGVAVDAVASKIIGFNTMDISTTRNAHERGLGIGKIEEIEILGEKIRDVEVRDFRHSAIAIGFLQRKVPQFLYACIQNQITLTPEVRKDKCTGCMECIKICPAGAAKLTEKAAWIDKSICIHCMCCHEVCRYQAIKLNQKPIGMILNIARTIYQKVNAFLT